MECSISLQQPTPEYLTPAQVEKLFGLKQATVRAWIRQGRMKGVKIDKLVLISTAEIRERFDRVKQGGDFLDDPKYISDISCRRGLHSGRKGVRDDL